MALIYKRDDCCERGFLEDYLLAKNSEIVKSNDGGVITFAGNKKFVMIGLKSNVEMLYNRIKIITDNSEFLFVYIDNISVSYGTMSCSILNVDHYTSVWNFNNIIFILKYSINIDNHTSVETTYNCRFSKKILDIIRNYFKTGVDNSEDILNEIKLELFGIFHNCGPVKNKTTFEIISLFKKIKPIHIRAISLFDLQIDQDIKNELTTYKLTLPELSELLLMNEDALQNTEFAIFYKTVSVLFFKLYNFQNLIRFAYQHNGFFIIIKKNTYGFTIDKHLENFEYKENLIQIQSFSIKLHSNLLSTEKQKCLDINSLYQLFLEFEHDQYFVNILQEQTLSNI